MPVVSFERIEAKLIFPGYNELGTDLAEIHNAISTGLCSYVLGYKNSAKVTHCRWLATANRMLHFYVTTENLTGNLIIILWYIIKVYVPNLFAINKSSAAVLNQYITEKTLKYLGNLI